uniref:Spondin-like TSP1 domain-containing protein n=1 Tax=Ciona savignyi TaxID=51511 RepID=H2YTB9_CIOSA
MKPSYTVLVVLLVVIFLTFESHGWRRRRRRRRAPPAIHCATSPWMQWSGCSLTCGGGVSTRTRTIIRHPQHGGRGCPHLTETRRCYTQPCPVPVTCKWGNWGTWSPCDPCFPGGRSRARNITTPAMFGGAQCPGTRALSDYFCTTQKTCIVRTCPQNMFSCLDGLGCISKRLRCNGDGDCSDFSDEDDCSRTQSPCRRTYVGIPNIDIAGSGYDITKLREEGRLLDNDKYNGRCMTVRSGELGKRFRSPANIQSYRF